MARLIGLCITLTATAALAASSRDTGGVGCCSLIFPALFVWVYRSGGVDWGRSIGTALVPGIFGWFIWRDREVTTGARVLALVTAGFQVFSIVLGILLALFARQLVLHYAPQLMPGQPPSGYSKPVDLDAVAEDPSLGLHPPAKIDSDPPGAKVFVNGEARGVTPLETPLSAGERNEVRVELDGYFPATQTRSPNARERLDLRFTLQAAARLDVTTEPAGARVLVGKKEVLRQTPGLTTPLELGDAEVLLLRPGSAPALHRLQLAAGTTPLEVTLSPGVKLSVTSTPDQADVLVDGQWLGQTPLDVYVAPKGKHTVEVQKEPFAPARRLFTGLAAPSRFDVKLVDTERLTATKAVATARARYDRLNDALEKLQEKYERMEHPPAKLERQLTGLEREMERSATALEEAEARLKELVESRGREPAAVSEPENVPEEPQRAE